jgi:16S rRNA (adenine1518-N6/adenine1519-N6)-dimethyltransferase
MQVRAKKNLGQHFLKDEDIARRIADTLSAENLPAGQPEWGELPILEIGPGMGVLTKYLMDTGRPLKAIELDHESVEFLNHLYPDLDVIEADFLKMNLDDIFPGEFFTL